MADNNTFPNYQDQAAGAIPVYIVAGGVAGGASPTKPGQITPLGFASLSVSGTAVLLSSVSGGIPSGATIATVVVNGNAVNWRDDGTAPTATVGTGGMGLSVGSQVVFTTTLNTLEFIAQTGSATLSISFYK